MTEAGESKRLKVDPAAELICLKASHSTNKGAFARCAMTKVNPCMWIILPRAVWTGSRFVEMAAKRWRNRIHVPG